MLILPNKKTHIKHIIGVLSGKGGVGKSLVTSLLAATLSNGGYKVGIMDGDITGPSIPKAFGIFEPLSGTQEEGVAPQESIGGVKVVSTNLLIENENEPIIWRGPLVNSMIKQFYTDINWGNLDFLFIDMPPGTSDVPLTVYTSIPLDGVIMVTTPQDLVSMIVKKAINMTDEMKVKILGLIENMSYVRCPHCGEEIKLYGDSHAEEIAKEHNIPLLDKLPIDPALRELVDKGKIELAGEGYLTNTVKLLEDLAKDDKK